MKKLSRVGVDLAKNIYQLHGVDRAETISWKKRCNRHNWLQVLMENIVPGGEVGMEACTGAHHWARQLQAKGYRVKLISPQFVKPYVKSNKTDANDAEAICEAMSRPGMRFVTVKTTEQQDLQAVHRIRASLVSQRTAKGNQIRGLVAEYGLVAPPQINCLRKAIPNWLEDAENGLSMAFRQLLNGLWHDLKGLDDRIDEVTNAITHVAQTHPDAIRLQQICGIGPLVATALLASVGDAHQFKNGRQMAASIGLTPRQHSSGDKVRLLGISKRGDGYLRWLLIHGARSAMIAAKNKHDRLSMWVKSIAKRRHPNIAAAALANKMTRMAWAMLSRNENYRAELAA